MHESEHEVPNAGDAGQQEDWWGPAFIQDEEPTNAEKEPELNSESQVAWVPSALERARALRLTVERASIRRRKATEYVDRELSVSPEHLMALYDYENPPLNDYLDHLAAAGWPFTSRFRYRSELVHVYADLPIRRVLRLNLGTDLSERHTLDYCEQPELDDPRSFAAEMATELRPRSAPVTVLISEGTTQEEAIALLKVALEQTRDHYSELLAAEDEPLPNETSEQERAGWPSLAVMTPEGSWRSPWWQGWAVLNPGEARDLATWLETQAQEAEQRVASRFVCPQESQPTPEPHLEAPRDSSCEDIGL